jgi:hypothetical protein
LLPIFRAPHKQKIKKIKKQEIKKIGRKWEENKKIYINKKSISER